MCVTNEIAWRDIVVTISTYGCRPLDTQAFL